MKKDTLIFSKLPIINLIWTIVRRLRILRKHRQVVAFWNPLIHDDFDEKIEKNLLRPKKLSLRK